MSELGRKHRPNFRRRLTHLLQKLWVSIYFVRRFETYPHPLPLSLYFTGGLGLLCVLIFSHSVPSRSTAIVLCGGTALSLIAAVTFALMGWVRAWKDFSLLRAMNYSERVKQIFNMKEAAERQHRILWQQSRAVLTVISYGILIAYAYQPNFLGISPWAWLGILVFWAIAYAIIASTMRHWDKENAPMDETRCPRCFYDISHSEIRCPECGLRRFDKQLKRRVIS